MLNLESEDIETVYQQFTETTNKVTQEVVGFRKRKQIPGLPTEIEKLCEERRQTRLEVLSSPGDEIVLKYRSLNKAVKKAVKYHKQKIIDDKVTQLESDFRLNNSHNLFKAVKEMENQRKKSLTSVKDKQGNLHTNTKDVLKVWEEHFQVHLNTRFPHNPDALNDIRDHANEASNSPDITREEVVKAIKLMKNRKAPGSD